MHSGPSLLAPRATPRRPTLGDLINRASSLPTVPSPSFAKPGFSPLASHLGRTPSRLGHPSQTDQRAPYHAYATPFFASSSLPNPSSLPPPLRAPSPRRPRSDSSSSSETLEMAKKKLKGKAKLKAKAIAAVVAKKASATTSPALGVGLGRGAVGAHDEGEQFYMEAASPDPAAHDSRDAADDDDRGGTPSAQHLHHHREPRELELRHDDHPQLAPEFGLSEEAAYDSRVRARSLSPPHARRGRSTRPRLLWASTLEVESLRVLDSHHQKAFGIKVPRLRGPGSEEGRLWSEELDRSGL
ncbi:hypothetical protein RQP46_002917 [Phenoliferia psychrophenolica]